MSHAITMSAGRDELDAGALDSEKWLCRMVIGLLLGYLCFGRGFSHLGISPVFIGEVVLGALLVFGWRSILGTSIGALVRPSAISHVAWCTFVFMAYGMICCLRGMTAGHDFGVALKIFVLQTYPLFFFAAVWMGRRDRELLPKVISWAAWTIGIYGTLFVFVISTFASPLGEGSTGVWGFLTRPMGVPIIVLGMLCFEKDLRRVWLPFTLNVVVLLGLQKRAYWMGILCCLPVFGVLTGNLRALCKLASVLVLILAIGFITNLRVSSPRRRGGELSARSLVAQVVAPVSPDLAARILPATLDASAYRGTIDWRTTWWMAIFAEAHKTPTRAILGPGYGFPVWNLHEMYLPQDTLRTPHNIFILVLGNAGWLGIAIFYAFLGSLLRLMWRVYQTTGQPFGLCLWVMAFVWAHFDNYFEAPYAAVPFYLLLGLAAAPLLPSAGEENDSLVGGADNDALQERLNDDAHQGQAGAGMLREGVGNSNLAGDARSVVLDGSQALFGHSYGDNHGDSEDDNGEKEKEEEEEGIVRVCSAADELDGGEGRDVLGESGVDTMTGGSRRELVVGNVEAEGGAGDDAFLGGATVHHANDAALRAILNEWKSSETNRIRASRGETPGGRNDNFPAAGVNLIEDGANDIRIVESDRDWYFASLADAVVKPKPR